MFTFISYIVYYSQTGPWVSMTHLILFVILDLALGDVHLVSIDDKESRDKGNDKVRLLGQNQ